MIGKVTRFTKYQKGNMLGYVEYTMYIDDSKKEGFTFKLKLLKNEDGSLYCKAQNYLDKNIKRQWLFRITDKLLKFISDFVVEYYNDEYKNEK